MERTFKLIVVGDSGIGKTTFLESYFNDSPDAFFLKKIQPTVGVDFRSIRACLNDNYYKLFFWDTCGQEKYNSMVNTYFRNADGVILCYSIDNENSFENLHMWISRIKDHCPSNVYENTVYLVGLKSDKQPVVTDFEILNFCEQHSLPSYNCSSKTVTNVHNTIEGIIKNVIIKCDKNHGYKQKQSCIDLSRTIYQCNGNSKCC